MRIGIDCRTILNPKLGERAGVGHYTFNLVKNLLKLDKVNEYILYFDHRVHSTKDFEQKNVKIKNLPFSQYNKFMPFAYSHMLISAYLLKHGLDIFHSPISSLPLTYPKKSLITVHDLAIYKNPSWFPTQIFSTKLLVPRSLNAADKIIAVSESTKKDIREIFNIPPKKIKVVYEAPNVTKVKVRNKKIDSLHKFKLPSKFVFFLGTIEPRKNLVGLLEAFRKVIDRNMSLRSYQLIIAGAKGYKNENVFSRIKELKLSKYVKYLGYVTHNQKIELLKKATCFAFPTSYEGFGLPVLEAMALGTPVITSNVSSLPEITKNSAVLVDPESTTELAAALQKIMTNQQHRITLSKKGLKRAKDFSWEKCARETLKVYKSMG
ncbi:glycosyltransferase family 4 protein [Patescibacteria group bacterium]|nr:glycosyltransferase family 4 protein [Patescibacteria group bacterium]